MVNKKNLLRSIAFGVVLGFLGYYIGYQQGSLPNSDVRQYNNIVNLKMQLKQKEKKQITKFIDGKASIDREDEGGLFSNDYVYYFEGKLTNEALLAKAKDVKLKIIYYSETDSKIGEKELTIYKYFKPRETKEFEKKIKVPKEYDDFDFQIVSAKADFTN